jgi:hypothetical protein
MLVRDSLDVESDRWNRMYDLAKLELEQHCRLPCAVKADLPCECK